MDEREVFENIQALKDEPWEAPPQVVASIRRTFSETCGREITSAELKAAVHGLGWIMRMSEEHGLDTIELMRITDDLEAHIRRNLRHVDMSVKDGLQVGLGAGFFTGLWLGLELKK